MNVLLQINYLINQKEMHCRVYEKESNKIDLLISIIKLKSVSSRISPSPERMRVHKEFSQIRNPRDSLAPRESAPEGGKRREDTRAETLMTRANQFIDYYIIVIRCA